MLETRRRSTETGLSARERILDTAEGDLRAAQRGKAMAHTLIDQHR